MGTLGPGGRPGSSIKARATDAMCAFPGSAQRLRILEPEGREVRKRASAALERACELEPCARERRGGFPAGPQFDRRGLLKLGGLAALSWILPGRAFAQEHATIGSAKSLIVIRLDGGPSQLETFDPKPGTKTGGPTRAIDTRIKGVQFCADYPLLAERADKLAILRSMASREGEHVRARYLLRTGFSFLPTVTYPSIGAVLAHELERDEVEIPHHVSLLSRHPGRGGFFGQAFNAFSVGDPKDPLTDIISPVGAERFNKRAEGLDLLEEGFSRGRRDRLEATPHRELVRGARKMMDSEQVKAFDYRQETPKTIASYGDTAFGRSCLVARRLVETGVPAVEVTLNGWDSHTGNFEAHSNLAKILDPGFSALLDDLAAKGLLDSTLVLCGGEFGRTPRVNGLDGRDHWTRGFSLVLAGGGLRVGQAIGETDPEGENHPTDPISVQDLFATIYTRLGIDGSQWFDSDQGRPAQLNKGKPIARLI